jgi:hypothetical protein
MNEPINDSALWAVLHYLRALHELLDWAPNDIVPERQVILANRPELAQVRATKRIASIA